MRKRITQRGRWILSHKRRFAALLGIGLVGAYGVTYAVAELHVSPTDRTVTLPDGRELGYHAVLEAVEFAPRVILVHGAPADASSWNTLIRREGEKLIGIKVLAIDRLGYGNSSAGAELSLEEHAKSLEPLIRDGVILVGHSYGGPVVLRAAAEFGDRIGGVVLVAGACDPNMNDSQWARKAADAVSAVVPDSWAVANRELLALTDENQAMESLLDRVTCKVVVMHGTWDPVCPHDGTVEYLRESLINAAEVRVVSLTRTGHNIHLSEPGRVVDEILRLNETTD